MKCMVSLIMYARQSLCCVVCVIEETVSYAILQGYWLDRPSMHLLAHDWHNAMERKLTNNW